MKRILIPALMSVLVLTATSTGFTADNWMGALERHVRSDILHSEAVPFHYEVQDSSWPGFQIHGERIHIENSLLTAHIDRITADDGMNVQGVDAKSRFSLGGDFLRDPIKNSIDQILAFTDMTAQKADMAFSITQALAGANGVEAGLELLAVPVRDVRLKLRDNKMEMWLKSLISVRAIGTASYRPAEKKIDLRIEGAWTGAIPIPSSLLFHTLKQTIKYPFVEIHKPYVTVDIGWFLFPAPAAGSVLN